MKSIHIEAVTPTAHELRPVKRGWGALHWVCILPTHAFLLGFLTFGLIARDTVRGGLFSVVLVASFLTWLVGLQVMRRVSEGAHRASPTGGLTWTWTIDGQFLTFANGLQTNRVDWRAVKAVIGDRDRFVFLVTPGYNPVLPKRLLDTTQLQALEDLIAALRTSGQLGRGVD